MANFISDNRSSRLLLPPDLCDWVPGDGLAHFIIEAVERVDLSAFQVNWKGTGKAQYHPRMMLSLLIYCYANGLFSSRRIERATHRDIGVCFVAADTHPDHDTIATFRRVNAGAITEAFSHVLLMAREVGLLKVGMVSIDGTKIDANASKIRSVRYDRAKALRAKLEEDIQSLLAQAEAADGSDQPDPQALPKEIARREDYEEKERAHHAREGRRGRAPSPPEETLREDRQTNLTDPDSRLMRKSKRHEYRQAYNAQAVVDADGSQLVLTTDVGQTPSDQPLFQSIIDGLMDRVGKPTTVLGDAGYASGEAVKALEAHGIEVLVAIGRPEANRPYDFRPPNPEAKPPPEPKAPWRIRMKERLQTEAAKKKYRHRKSTVEPVFGIIKSVLGFTRFHLRSLEKVKNEWALVTLAYNCKRIANLKAP
jgi:transposase